MMLNVQSEFHLNTFSPAPGAGLFKSQGLISYLHTPHIEAIQFISFMFNLKPFSKGPGFTRAYFMGPRGA
jgi:hypothetical protein